MNLRKVSTRTVLCLVLLGLGACSELPTASKESTVAAKSLDARQQACINLARQIRLVCTDGLKEFRGRGGSARSNFDCMSTRLEFQNSCI